MRQIFCIPQFQALSSTGSPLPQARLHFFATGTTNPATVYADVARTQTLANPLTADAQGRFPRIFPDPDQVYRVRLTNSAGVQQWDENGISLFLFMRTQREIVAGVTPFNYGYPPGDVRRYGADATGQTSSSQAFLDATRSTHAVYIPEGTFEVTGVTFSGTVTWRGEGAKSVIRSDSAVVSIANGTGSHIDNLYLENITPPLLMRRDPNNWNAPYPPVVRTNDPGYPPTDIDTDYWQTLTMAEQEFLSKQEVKGPMIAFDGGTATNVTVSRIYGRMVTVYLKGCTKSVVRDCNFRAGRNFGGIFIDGTHTLLAVPTTGQNKVLDNFVEYGSNAGVALMAQLDSEARGNTCSRNGEVGIKTEQGLDSGTITRSCERIMIANNIATDHYYGGIDAASRFPLDRSQNLFHTLIGNMAVNSREAAIGFDGNFVNAVGNTTHLNHWEGIYADTAHSSVVGNLGAGNARAADHNDILLGGLDNLCANNHIHMHESGGYGIWSLADNVVSGNFVTGGNMFLGEPVVNRTNLNADASGSGGFTKPPLTLGNHRLWVDSGGRLRIKNGVPTADTDGTVVGAQT